MSFFNKIFGNNNKIKVQFIDNFSGQTIAVAEMEPNTLPETFEIATTMHIDNTDWKVEEAIPAKSIDFIKTKQLILKMRRMEMLSPKDILFTIPTISNELPALSQNTLFNDFELILTEDDWRQKEFLPVSEISKIEIETEKIQHIWANDKKEVNGSFNAFTNCHVRNTIGEPKLRINFDELSNLLKAEQTGCIKFNGNNDFIKNGFAFTTANTTYYGIIENKKVTEFCIYNFSDESISEIQKITNRFEVIYINWYDCEMIK